MKNINPNVYFSSKISIIHVLSSFNLSAKYNCVVFFLLVGEEKKPDAEGSGEGLFPVKITQTCDNNTIIYHSLYSKCFVGDMCRHAS